MRAKKCVAATNMSTAESGTLTGSSLRRAQESADALTVEDLQRVISCIQDELRALTERRAAILRRITVIRNTIAGLDRVFGPGASRELMLLTPRGCFRNTARAGLTQCCRLFLKRAGPKPVALPQLIGFIRMKTPELFAAHKNPAASVRTILNRLVSYGEAIEVRAAGNVRAWQATSLLSPQGDVARAMQEVDVPTFADENP